MYEHIFIGCDIGTSSTKAVAVNEDGVILAEASKPYGIIQYENNWAEQHPDIWLAAATDTLQTVIANVKSPERIRSLCISALYGGTGALCDSDMNIIRPAIIWMDRRAEQESEQLRRDIGQDRLCELTGNGIDSYFGYTKLLWLQNNEPDNWSKIRHILPVHSYIVYKMTGQLSIDYSSAGNLGGVYDYTTHTWSRELCEKLNIPLAYLPQKFCAPEDIAGTLTPEYAKKLGLPGPIPVCAGTVDCISSMLSASIIKQGDNAAVLGTSLNWGYIHSKKPDNPNLISMPYCIMPQKLSYTYGGASTAGALPRWFIENFISGSGNAYKELESDIFRLAIPAGSDGLVALPYFMGERTPIWDENASGVIFGLSLSHTKAHIYRALLESVAYSLRHIMESMDSKDITQIILVGGGARSPLWRQVFADVTGLPVLTPVAEIEAPLGDAFLAAKGYGYAADYTLIKSWIKMNPAVMPDMNNHALYNEYFEIYKELYLNLKSTMSKRTTLLKKEKGETVYEN